MQAKIPRWARFLAVPLSVGVLALALAAGCQSYDFQPVQPLAIAQKTQSKTLTARQLDPDLMLLVDTSGSMTLPTDPTDPDCHTLPDGGICGQAGGQQCTPSVCPTRWSELEKAMDGFLTQNGTVARMGLAFFPDLGQDNDSCGPSSALAVPLSASDDVSSDLQATANQIDSAIQSHLPPAGGTPTNFSLQFVQQQYSSFDTKNRRNFVLLLTDGVPNCNPDNPADYWDAGTGCVCVAANCDTSFSHITGCLDQNGTVQAAAALADGGIDTIVVGFGADATTGDAPAVLSAVALAGGFPKTCPNGTDAECGAGDTCNTTTHVCNIPYYQANNGAELATALANISKSIGGNPCVFVLDSPPADPNLITVLIDGTETPAGTDTWKYDSADGEVVFQGALCTELQNSNPNNPVDVEIRSMQTL